MDQILQILNLVEIEFVERLWNPILVPFLNKYNLPTTFQGLRQDLNNISRPFTHQVETHISNFVKEYNINYIELIVLVLVGLWLLNKILSIFFSKKDTGFIPYKYSDDRTIGCLTKLRMSVQSSVFQFLCKWLPPVRNVVAKQIQKSKNDFIKDFTKSFKNQTFNLPKVGMSVEKIEARLQAGYEFDEDLTNKGQISGTRYAMTEYEDKMKDFVKEYLFHNPLHASEFPNSRQMEAEIIKMTCGLYNHKKDYGIITNGGSESIMMGILAHRNYYNKTKGITKPNIIMPISAHVAFNKACWYYHITPIIVGLNPDNTVNISEVRKAITKDTICIVAGNPSYAAGSQDDIQALGKLALKHDVGLHVDSCLGSFVMPFAEELQIKGVEPFDFRVPGVSSISCDHHKFGLAPKGISMCMYKSMELRQAAYFTYSEWPGGLYATAQPAGSRTSAPIAGCWFAMMYHGHKGYKENARKLFNAGALVRKEIRENIPELEIMGKQETFVVGFSYKKRIKPSIYQLDNEMHSRGWTLNGLQKPNGVHICITLPVANNIQNFIKDLKESVKVLKQDPKKHANSTSGSVGVYGASGQIPDTTTKDLVLANIVDVFTTLKYDNPETQTNSNKTPKKVQKK